MKRIYMKCIAICLFVLFFSQISGVHNYINKTNLNEGFTLDNSRLFDLDYLLNRDFDVLHHNEKQSFSNPNVVYTDQFYDANGDKIADSLFELIDRNSQKLSISDKAFNEISEKVEVIICVNKKPNYSLIDKLNSYGADIISIHDNLIYAFSAIVPLNKIELIAQDDEITFIEKQAFSEALLDTSTVNMGVRGSSYVWDATPTIKGNPNYAIAILDTGVDSSHPDMSNFIYFEDFSNEGYPNGSTGVDHGHHGTHCASIAAGTGEGDINPETAKQTISRQFSGTTSYYYVTHWFEVKDYSNNPNTIVTLDWDTSGSGSAYFAVWDSSGFEITSHGPYSSSPVSHNLGNIAAGWYQVVCAPIADNTRNKVYTITINHEYAYFLADEPVNSPLFAGVAPQSNIVSLKVLDDTGSGIGTWFLNALDWISANGKNPAYNITTVSMSIGFDGIYSSIDSAVNNLVDEGFICVASAGNDGTNYGENAVNSPGTAQKCITVGAVNDAFEVTYYSSNGNTTLNKPDVLAPGGTIVWIETESGSAHNLIIAADSNYGEMSNSMSDVVANDYRGMQGTSMSCPHIAGLAQLVIDAIIQKEGSWAWSQENAFRVKQLICMGTWEVNAGETHDEGDEIPQNPPINRVGSDVVEGYGMVRADAVIQAITHPTSGSFTDVEYYLDRRPDSHAKDPKVILFSFNAQADQEFNFTLNVPVTGDFDLIIYDCNYDTSSGRPIIFSSSTNNGLGIDEFLQFIPSADGVYHWSIRAVEGYGTCQISLIQESTAPNSPTNPYPADGSYIQTTNPTISVDVSDPNGDILDVYFYNALDDSLIGSEMGVTDGAASTIWSELSYDESYSWYTIADDGSETTQSSTWSFTVKEHMSFEDNFETSNWELIDVVNEYFYETFGGGLVETVTVIGNSFYHDQNMNGPSVTNIGDSGGPIWTYLKVSSSLPTNYLTDCPGSDIIVIKGAGHTWLGGCTATTDDLKFDVSTTNSFDPDTITWDNKPSVGTLLVDNFNFFEFDNTWQYIDLGTHGQQYLVLTPSYSKSAYYMSHISEEYYFPPQIQKQWGKFCQNNGYAYMQTNTQEELKIRSNVYENSYSLEKFDCFVLDIQAKTGSQITLDLLKDGILQQSIIVVPSGNTNFDRHTVNIPIPEDVEFDQLQFSGTLQNQDYFKCHDITIDYAPVATNPNPFDSAISVILSPTLSVNVYDPEGSSMDVSFYDATDDSLIGTALGVASGSIASITWSGLSEGSSYSWYVIVGDGVSTAQSSTWQFATNYAPLPSNPEPSDGAVGVILNPKLNVTVSDHEGCPMAVSFYNATDGSLIGAVLGVASGSIASITWSGLSYDASYSWYVIVDDGISTAQSSTWQFATNYAPLPSNPEPSDGAVGVILNPKLNVTVSDSEGCPMDVSFYNATDGSLIGTVLGVASGSIASITWSGLSEGNSYSWYVIVDDGILTTQSSTWQFTTYSDIPTWDTTPTDQVVEFGDSFSYDLNASDLSGIDSWWINDTITFNINTEGFITNILELAIGEYWLEVRAYDPFNHYCTITIKITVEDTTNPTWDFTLEDQTLEYGDSFYYDVNASDISGINYYWINNTANFQIDSTGLITENSILSIGEYWIEVRAYDPSSNYCTTTIKITVEDTINPTWDTIPTDQVVEFGDSFSYDLNASDLSGINSWWINDTTTFSINAEGTITNIIGLAVGKYWLEVRAYDPFGNYCTATIKIIVEDTINPTWDTIPTDQVVEFGDSFSYDLSASDLSGIDSWWINDTTTFSINAEGTITNIIGLAVSEYWLEVRAYDPFGNYCTATIKIAVEDNTKPIINSPPDIQYEQGSTDHNITWTAYDLNPATYTIYLNDGVLSDGLWVSGESIYISVDGHIASTYNYTIEIMDLYGNIALDTVIVTVVIVIPEITPFNHIFVVFSISFSILYLSIVKKKPHKKEK